MRSIADILTFRRRDLTLFTNPKPFSSNIHSRKCLPCYFFPQFRSNPVCLQSKGALTLCQGQIEIRHISPRVTYFQNTPLEAYIYEGFRKRCTAANKLDEQLPCHFWNDDIKKCQSYKRENVMSYVSCYLWSMYAMSLRCLCTQSVRRDRYC